MDCLSWAINGTVGETLVNDVLPIASVIINIAKHVILASVTLTTNRDHFSHFVSNDSFSVLVGQVFLLHAFPLSTHSFIPSSYHFASFHRPARERIHYYSHSLAPRHNEANRLDARKMQLSFITHTSRLQCDPMESSSLLHLQFFSLQLLRRSFHVREIQCLPHFAIHLHRHRLHIAMTNKHAEFLVGIEFIKQIVVLCDAHLWPERIDFHILNGIRKLGVGPLLQRPASEFQLLSVGKRFLRVIHIPHVFNKGISTRLHVEVLLVHSLQFLHVVILSQSLALALQLRLILPCLHLHQVGSVNHALIFVNLRRPLIHRHIFLNAEGISTIQKEDHKRKHIMLVESAIYALRVERFVSLGIHASERLHIFNRLASILILACIETLPIVLIIAGNAIRNFRINGCHQRVFQCLFCHISRRHGFQLVDSNKSAIGRDVALRRHQHHSRLHQLSKVLFFLRFVVNLKNDLLRRTWLVFLLILLNLFP